MAVVMSMEWPAITPANYEAIRKDVNWEGDVPSGAMFHVAAFTDEGMRVTDVWESAEQFNAFVASRLMPAVQAHGLPGQPKVQIHPAYAIFAPGV